ncbi:MAG: type I-C CRISPR-associated protein Cas8c/Csd1 [Candidatus Firestonebacteria bacterium]
MILQALYEYYQRKAANTEGKIAPEGWEWKEIPFLVVIDKEGKFLRINDTRQINGNKKRANVFLVPQGEKRTTGIKPFLLWDNIEYALGANPRNRKDVHERFDAFKKRILNAKINHCDIKAIVKFLDSQPSDQIKKSNSSSESWKEMLESNPFVSFKIEGSDFQTICDVLPKEKKEFSIDENVQKSICSVTGEISNIARLHSSIKGVRGTNTQGASIVSFNLPAFNSYGKKQSYNSPVSEKVAFAYSTALNMLLGKDSQNKISIADTTVLFWSQKQSEKYDFEADFRWYFKTDKADPEKGVKAVKNLYEALHSGKLPLDEGNRFYVLGLAPNSARISVRFWKTGAIRDFAEKIKQHFEDFEMKLEHNEPEYQRYMPLLKILSATAFDYKMDNVPPNLAGQVVVSILEGTPYPQTLLQQCIRRIRAEQQVTRVRAAILKAYINRFNKFYKKPEKEVLMSLDRSNINTAYRLGRLFAVLEKIQEEANPKINATIRDRFYGAVSATPITVFPQLLKLKNHHLAKLNPGRKVNFEKEIGEIFDALKDDLPSHLTLDEQARFAVGYYHERQDYFTKKDKQ